MNKKRYYLFILLLLSTKIVLFSQSIELIDNNFNSFVTNESEALWISSQGGWNKYDGVKTHHYLVNDSISGLKGEWIQSGIWKDDKNRYWTCTYDHLCYYTNTEDKFNCIQLSFDNKIYEKGIRLIGLDSESQQPILKAENTLFYFDSVKEILTPLKGDNKTNVPLFSTYNKIENSFVGFGGVQNSLLEIWTKIYSTWKSKEFDFQKCNSLKNVFTSDAVFYEQDIILATSQGLMFLNKNNFCNSSVIKYKGQTYKSYHLIEKDGYILITTDKFGILVYDILNSAWEESITSQHEMYPLNQNHPIEIFDIGDEIFVAYRKSKPQVLKWDKLLPYFKLESNGGLLLNPQRIYSNNDYLVLSSYRDNIEIYKGNNIYDYINIKTIGSLRNYYIKGRHLYFHDESKLYKYDLITKQLYEEYQNKTNSLQEVFHFNNHIFLIIENKAYELINSNLHPVTIQEQNGVNFHNYLTTDIVLTSVFNKIYLSSNNQIDTIQTNSYLFDYKMDSLNNLLYLALGNGLGIYDINKKVLEVYSLSDFVVNKIHRNHSNQLTLATSIGIYTYKSGKFSRLDTKKTNISELVIQDSIIFYITDEGLHSIPLQPESKNTPIKLKIQQENHPRKINNKNKIKYKYKSNAQPLSLNILSENYKANETGHLSFEISGYNLRMRKQSLNDPIQIPPLGPGHYTILITGKDHFERPFEKLEIELIVKGPIWLEWWFAALTIGMIFLMIFFYFRYKNNILLKEMAIKEEINGLKKSALQAQMNPHFIFNCLNSIQNFIMHNDKEKAMEYLGKFAKLIRLNLKASIEEKISLTEEIAILENYLNLEQLRLSNRFTYNISVPELLDTNAISISPMLIQPFIENAVIHGMNNISDNGIINLSFELSNNVLFVEVFDNGKSSVKLNQQVPKRKSYGVSITQKRLNHINKTTDRSTLNIVHSDTGTIVSMEIKL